MVDMIAHHGKQVKKAVLYTLNPPGKLRQPRCEFGKSRRLELLFVNDDAATIA